MVLICIETTHFKGWYIFNNTWHFQIDLTIHLTDYKMISFRGTSDIPLASRSRANFKKTVEWM